MNPAQRSAQDTARVRLAELDTVSVSTPAEVAPGPELAGHPVAAGPGAVLEIRRGPDTGHRFALATDTVSVLGRHPGCEIVLSNVTVSRRHADIRPTHDGFVLTDSGSLNGSYLNGTPIDAALLADGDDIQIGIFRLVFHSARTANPATTLSR